MKLHPHRVMQLSALILFLTNCKVQNAGNAPQEASKVKQASGDTSDILKRIVGDDLNGGTVSPGSCNTSGCHNNIAASQLVKWTVGAHRAFKVFDDSSLTANQKKDWLYNAVWGDNWQDLGLFRAMMHDPGIISSFAPSQDRNDNIGYKYMPAEETSEHARLNPTETMKIAQWIRGYTGSAEQVESQITADIESVVGGSPDTGGGEFETCRPLISEKYKAHIKQMGESGWTTINRNRGMRGSKMFACSDSSDGVEKPLNCFKQERGGADIFPIQESWKATTSATYNPPPAASVIRVIKDTSDEYHSYWTRVSPDGFFAATGGRGIDNFQKILDPNDPRNDKIPPVGSYDPGFSPDGTAFMYQDGGVFCQMASLEMGNLTSSGGVDTSTYCTSPESFSVDLYQSMGGILPSAGNAQVNYYLTAFNGSWSGDPGDHSEDPVSGTDDSVQIGLHYFDANSGKIRHGNSISVATPQGGSWFISPTGRAMMGARNTNGKQDGYIARMLDLKVTGSGGNYQIENTNPNDTQPVAEVCIRGTKPVLSYDDRFLVTHHYIDGFDGPEYGSDLESKKHKTADLFLVDMKTGKSYRLTNMPAGWKALYPHFRNDGWIVFWAARTDSTASPQGMSGSVNTVYATTDAAIRIMRETGD